MFAGIGAAERLDVPDRNPLLELRVGTPDTGIRIHQIRVTIGRWYESMELHSPMQGSFASVRLSGEGERTRVSVTYFSPGRMHPQLAKLSNGAITAWTEAGLRRIEDIVRGARTSVVVNGENSPVRRQVGVLRQVMTTGVVNTGRPDVAVKQLRSLSKWGFNLAGGGGPGGGPKPPPHPPGARTGAPPPRRCAGRGRSGDRFVRSGSRYRGQGARGSRLVRHR